MKNLYIIGARGFGREIYHLATETREYEKDYRIAGFLDDNEHALDGFKGYPPIISSVEKFIPGENDVCVCALGDVKYKKKYTEIILEKEGRFFTLIHPTAYIAPNTTVGVGCIITAYCRISCDVQIGDYNTFQPFTSVGHDVIIGNYCHFNTYSFMGGFVTVEDEVTLHTGAIVHPHKRIKNNCTIGAGAVVLRNVPEKTTLYGNPAVKLKF